MTITTTDTESRVYTREMSVTPGFRGTGYHGETKVARVVANWHDETHAGGFLMCQEQPCAAVRLAD